MAEDKSKKELLEELREQVIKYVRAEKLRLSVERDFLSSVLSESLGGPTKKAKLQEDLDVVEDVRKFLTIKEKRQ